MTTATKTRKAARKSQEEIAYVSAITVITTSTGKTKTTIDVEQMVKNVKEGGLSDAIEAIEKAEMAQIKAAQATAGTYWDLGEVFLSQGYGKLRKKKKGEFWEKLGSGYETDSPNRRRCERAIRIRKVNAKRDDVFDRTVNQAMLYGSRVSLKTNSLKNLNTKVWETAVELREDRESREKGERKVAADPIIKSVGTLVNSPLYGDAKVGTKAEQAVAAQVIKTANNKLKKLRGMNKLGQHLRPIVIMQLVVKKIAELYPNEVLIGNHFGQTEEEFLEFVGDGCDPADEKLLRMEKAVNDMFDKQEEDAA